MPTPNPPYLFGFTSRLVGIHFPGPTGHTGPSGPTGPHKYQGYFIYQPSFHPLFQEFVDGSWQLVDLFPGLLIGYPSLAAAMAATAYGGPFTDGTAEPAVSKANASTSEWNVGLASGVPFMRTAVNILIPPAPVVGIEPFGFSATAGTVTPAFLQEELAPWTVAFQETTIKPYGV